MAEDGRHHRYLFHVSVGPVQEFIAAARRTRDLWAGSQLLSALSRVAAQTLRSRNADPIFPAHDQLEHHEVVNHIVVALHADDDPVAAGQAVEAAIKGHLAKVMTIVFNNQQRVAWPEQPGYRERAEQQMADLPEIFWAAVPLTGDYQADRKNLVAALAARKNTREFRQPTWSANVPKSSIDGVRESVIDEREYALPGATEQERRASAERLFKHYGAGPAERLSGVDVFKRHYLASDNGSDFPSTSHFAALPLFARWRERVHDYRDVLKRYIETLWRLDARPERLNHDRFAPCALCAYNGDPYDASIVFEERLSDITDAVELASVRGALADFYQAMGSERPEPYYAILHADGDYMGKVIDHLAEQGFETHQQFSQQLDAFASRVRQTVEQMYCGALVYSGGDDVLAFLPLDTVLACAKELARNFHDRLEPCSYVDPARARSISPTLSVGIAIVHHLEPLSEALQLARAAEMSAKQVPAKNGLAITLSKRGSGDRTISGSWADTFYDRLVELTELHRADAIPDSAAYDLHNLVERVGQTLSAQALQAEAIRIVKRKRGQHGRENDPTTRLVDLAKQLPSRDTDTAVTWNVQQFANELIITREFAKAKGKHVPNKGAAV